MNARLLITISDRGRTGVQVALTDRAKVYRRRRWRSATTAAIDVYRLLRRGHRLAFPSALRDLEAAVAGELAAPATAQAAD